MKALRKIEDVKSGSIKIDLPADFHAKRVEIIILPIDESENGRQLLQDLLLQAPTLTDEELQEYNSVRDWMSKWSIKEF
ncbi:MAG: hypothetical protein GWN67_08650 [Phycisphaerae bacterium]|nr:hypothetical protein [Candidatus Bathyarchaeota archaeon]NIU56440.1 hypothetical protein [Phycisphaerae bacterium]